MELTGDHRIPAPRDRVFAALCDPGVLKRCVPPAEEIVRLSELDYAARVLARIGPLKARFDGRLQVDPIAPPAHYVLLAEGQGGLAGFVRGRCTVRLEPDAAAAGATILTYHLAAEIGGRLGQLATRLVQGAAYGYVDRFFARFTEAVAAFDPAATPAGFAGAAESAPRGTLRIVR